MTSSVVETISTDTDLANTVVAATSVGLPPQAKLDLMMVLSERIVSLMTLSFILGALFAIFLFVILDLARARRSKKAAA